MPGKLYPSTFAPEAFSVGMLAAGSGAPLPRTQLHIQPSAGRFSFVGGQPVGTLAVCYNFGLASEIGAGGYNTSILSDLPVPESTTRLPAATPPISTTPLQAVAADANIQIADTLTYAGPTQTLTVPGGRNRCRLRAQWRAPRAALAQGRRSAHLDHRRPGRPAQARPLCWCLRACCCRAPTSCCKASFDSVYLRMMTLDPGTSYAPPVLCHGQKTSPPPNPLPMYGTAIDGMPLAPGTLYIEGSITNLVLERTIAGPIRTRYGGASRA